MAAAGNGEENSGNQQGGASGRSSSGQGNLFEGAITKALSAIRAAQDSRDIFNSRRALRNLGSGELAGAGKFMTNDSITIEIAHGDRPPAVRSSLSIDEAADIIRGLANEPDVTVTVSPADMDAEVVLAISDAKFFLGLFRSSGEVYQYVARGNEGRHGKILFSISGEPTNCRPGAELWK